MKKEGIRITLRSEKCFIIRCTNPNGRKTYFCSHQMWSTSPSNATIFRSYEDAEEEMWHSRYTRRLIGSTEILDVVDLYGAIISSPTKSGFAKKS